MIPKHITVGVAGHIDHGKTALVRALTGTETDRLKEEQARGMSIVLGFAHLRLPGGEVDLIDVPGHEKFVKTMIAGATGIDAVLLVIAANERVKPQTVEHLALTELLGVERGLIVVTKSDLAPSPDERARIAAEVRAFVGGTVLRDAPLRFTSAATGEGLDGLRGDFESLLALAPAAPDRAEFYLPIDRAFTLTGHGTVVTGTLRRGALRLGQGVEIVPGGRRAEVRGLQVHGRDVAQAAPGWRTAVNLRGVKKEEIAHGDALATPALLRPTRLLDVQITLLRDLDRPLTHGHTVRLHHGTAEILGRVYPLDRDQIAPGETALAQMRFREDVYVPVHTRFVLRVDSPAKTLGGGLIVDAHPHKHTRSDAEAVRRVETFAQGTPAEKLQAKLEEAGFAGQEITRLLTDLDLTEDDWEREHPMLPVALCPGGLALHRACFADLCARALRAVHQFHQTHPTLRGMPREEMRRRLPKEMPPPAFTQTLETLIAQGQVKIDGGAVRESGFRSDALLTEQDREILRDLERRFLRGRLQPPNLSDVLGTDKRRRTLYQYLRQSETLVELTDRTTNRAVTFHRDALAYAERALRRRLAGRGGATVSEINSLLATTRKYSIPLLEFLDARGLTRREGDLRVWGKDSLPATHAEAGAIADRRGGERT